MKIVVINGFNKFPLSDAAFELEKRGHEIVFIAGAMYDGLPIWLRYPVARMGLLEKLKERSPRLADGRQIANIVAEAVHYLGRPLRLKAKSRFLNRIGRWSDTLSFKLFSICGALKARRDIRQADAVLARSGFLGQHGRVARQANVPVFVYQSIPHPDVFHYLVRNQGRWPDSAVYNEEKTGIETLIDADLELSDIIVCEGKFVQESLIRKEFEPTRTKFVFQGIDNYFLKYLDSTETMRNLQNPSAELLFVGASGPRKGLDDVFSALETCRDLPWHLTVVSDLDASHTARITERFGEERISVLSYQPRRTVAEIMAKADVFVFPTRAEGSVRVIFEALAAGCFVLTTPNSGSVVEDGVHGRIIPPGDPDALANAFRDTLSDLDSTRAVGARNADFVRTHFHQAKFGEQIDQVISDFCAVRTHFR